MSRRLAHFSDPRLDAQVEELIKHGNSTRETADKHAGRRDNPHKVTPEQIGAPSAADVQAKVDTHAAATTGVHGVGASSVESTAGAQAKVDAHATRTDNPHQVTAGQAGAVAKTGDTMTGQLKITGQWQSIILEADNSNEVVFKLPNGPTNQKIISIGRIPATASLGIIRRNDDNSHAALLLELAPSGVLKVNGSTVWHAGNDGAGSGSDMDMLDGYHGSYFQPASDERLKADIQPLPDALAKVLSLRGVSFTWNEKAQEIGANRQTLAGREIGLLAGEVAQAVPEVVLDWVETPDGEKYKTVDSARLVALLVEAIKELNAKVEALQARVAALEGGTP